MLVTLLITYIVSFTSSSSVDVRACLVFPTSVCNTSDKCGSSNWFPNNVDIQQLLERHGIRVLTAVKSYTQSRIEEHEYYMVAIHSIHGPPTISKIQYYDVTDSSHHISSTSNGSSYNPQHIQQNMIKIFI